jgi:hypothetical protein
MSTSRLTAVAWAMPGNAHEDRQSRGEIRIPLTQAEEVGLNGGELVSDLAQPLGEVASQQGERTIFCRLRAAVRSLIRAWRRPTAPSSRPGWD